MVPCTFLGFFIDAEPFRVLLELKELPEVERCALLLWFEHVRERPPSAELIESVVTKPEAKLAGAGVSCVRQDPAAHQEAQVLSQKGRPNQRQREQGRES